MPQTMTDKATHPLSLQLGDVGKDDSARAAILQSLSAWEKRNQPDGVDVRETTTGPIADALHLHVPAVTRTLTSGIVFTMPYRSKIAREFAMADAPLHHVWEPQTLRLLLALAVGAKTVVFGGAYAGDQAVPVAHSIAAAGGQVHCFEVNPIQLDALRLNARQNSLTNVHVNAMGLWDRPGHIELVGDDSHAAPKWVTQATAQSFPVTSIETWAGANAVMGVDLIMLDIEGGELHALQGARRFLEEAPGKAPDCVFEIHSSYVDWSRGLAQTAPVKLLLDRGYEVFALRDYQANVQMRPGPIELVPLEGCYLEGPAHGFNLFATKRPDRVKQLGAVLRPGLSPKLLRHRLSALHQPG
jgi:FkbM family methyltransferase